MAVTFSPRLYKRFSQMTPVAADNECWLWKGRLDAKGYGFIKVGNLSTRAHRIAWAINSGVMPPKGMVVRHTCDVPRCVNPSHLVLGTVKDNVQDCVQRGRRAKGEKVGQSKLTENDVRAIRAAWANGETQASIADRYGLTRPAIGAVVRRVNWKHVP